MESFQFIAPARVKVSLVPLDGISPETFHRYAQLLKSVTDIRLLDLPPLPDCRHFNPQEFSQGRIFYNTSEGFSDETAFLDDFEPFRKTFIIIGIGLHQVSTSTKSKHLESLKTQCPAAIAHHSIYFQSSEKDETNAGIFHMSEESETISTAIETIMCGITSHFLTALDDYASSYESITLRSPISLQDTSALTRTIHQTQKRISSGSSFKASFSNGQSAISSAKDQKVKLSQRQTGRRNKIMATFYLLAGRANLALQYYTDAAINAKKADDHLWLASALEGLSASIVVLSYLGQPCQIHNPMFAAVLHLPKTKSPSIMKSSSRVSMESVVSRQSASGATPRSSTSSSVNLGSIQATQNIDVSQIQVVELLLLLAQRCSHYYKASTADAVDCVSDIVFVESLMRNVKIMVTVYSSNGSDTKSVIGALSGFDAVVKQGDGSSFQLSQHTIVAEISSIFSLQLHKLDFTIQCKVYCALASFYHDLGLRRKYGLVLRLLLEVLMPYVSKYKEGFMRSDSMISVKDIIELLLKTYGLDINTETSGIQAAKHYSDWIVLQLSLIKVCLRIAENSQDHDTLMKLCVLTLSRFTHCLPVDDQIKLRDKLLWLRAITNHDGDSSIPHPDPFFVREAKFVVQPQSTGLALHVNNNVASEKASLNDPLVNYNRPANLDRVICQGDPHYLKVTLQNPFHFNLDIRSIIVVAEANSEVETIASMLQLINTTPLISGIGASTPGWKNVSKVKKPQYEPKSQADNEGFLIPPNSVADVKVGFRVLKPGELKIKGFEIRLDGSQPQFFCITGQEIFHGREKLTFVSPEKETGNFHLLDDFVSGLLSEKKEDRVDTQTIELSVIPLQPELVTIFDPSVSSWSMLLEGEVQSSVLRVQNSSGISVDHLSFSLWDSTLDSLKSKLNQSDLNAAEVYEYEWQLLKKKPLSVTNKSYIASEYKIIQPQGEMKIEYEIVGRRAATKINLILEYGKKSDDGGSFFHKTLVVPFNVTVHRSLEIIANDIIPISSYSWDQLSSVISSKASTPLQVCPKDTLDFISSQCSKKGSVSDFCLLVLDIKNFWEESLTAKLCSTAIEDAKFTIEVGVLPGSTSRVFIPIQRIKSGQLNLSQAIPSLRNKQFIKNYNLSEEDERLLKQAFWVKEEVLKNVTGSWSSFNSTTMRSGEIDLRKLYFDSEMAGPLLQEDLTVSHFITSEENEAEVSHDKGTLVLQREKFYVIKTRILNHTQNFVSGILRHVPIPRNALSKQDLSIDQKILYNGVLQIHTGGECIGPGQTYELELGFMVLEKGEYEWGCTFDISGEGQETIIGQTPVHFVAN